MVPKYSGWTKTSRRWREGGDPSRSGRDDRCGHQVSRGGPKSARVRRRASKANLRGRAKFRHGTGGCDPERSVAFRNNNDEMYKKKQDIPQVESPTQGQSTLGSDRVKAPVAHGSGTESEGRKLCTESTTISKTKKTDKKYDLACWALQGRPRRDRTTSASSAGSVSSLASVNDSDDRQTNLKTGQTQHTKTDATILQRDECDLTELLELIQTTATRMAEAAAVQKNINMTIKTGIKTILEAADVALSKRVTVVPERRIIGDDTTETETETNPLVTPRTKRKREATGTTPESSQKRVPGAATEASWKTVTNKKTKLKGQKKTSATNENTRADGHSAAPKQRGLAVLVRPGKDKTYSDIVRKIRATVDPTKNNVQVKTVRKTKDGLCLIKMQSDTDGRDDFRRALQDAVGNDGSVKSMISRVQVEIMDLDCAVTKDDVTQALRQETGRDGDFGVHIFGPNRAEQYMAVCDLESQEADALLGRARIGIGWVHCRVRKRLTVTKCHKCLGYGHTKTNCQGKDRTKSCRKCGETGHYATECKNRPACPLCAEAGHADAAHLPGSGKCAVFRAALEECKRQTGRRTA